MEYTVEFFQKSADYVMSIIKDKPEIAIILGSGLGGFVSKIKNPIEIKYDDIPNFLVSTVASHAGKLIYGEVGGKKVICMAGRFHSYEGYDYEQLVIPIRLFKLIGVKATILTNAAGAVNTDYPPPHIMIVSDHIKLNGATPLRGKNIDFFGPRFFDVTDFGISELKSH